MPEQDHRRRQEPDHVEVVVPVCGAISEANGHTVRIGQRGFEAFGAFWNPAVRFETSIRARLSYFACPSGWSNPNDRAQAYCTVKRSEVVWSKTALPWGSHQLPGFGKYGFRLPLKISSVSEISQKKP